MFGPILHTGAELTPVASAVQTRTQHLLPSSQLSCPA